jgi:hypothetical protein
MLWERLSELTLRLIVNTAPREISFDEKICQPFCAEAHSICMVLYSVIKASHLNTLEVGLSLQHKFDGQLRRNKVGMLGYTSLSLFMDDVECLLRDLYGESDNQAIALVRDAVFSIVDELTKYVRNDLWQEHCNAQHIHHVFRSGLPVSGSQFCDMNRAVRDLTQRARDVRANPTAFSKYTVSFVDYLYENWRFDRVCVFPSPSERRPSVLPATSGGPSVLPATSDDIPF